MNSKLNRKKKKLIKRSISLTVAFAMLLNELLVWNFLGELPIIKDIENGLSLKVSAAEDPGDDTLFVHNADNSIEVDIVDLVSYSANCQIYSTYHQNDKIIIVAGKGYSDYFESGFRGIGTENKPFKGSIEIGANTNAILNLDAPLFNYVYDSVTINNGNSFDISRYYPANATTDKTTPIIAKNVIHDADNSTLRIWNIDLVKPSDFNQSSEHNLGEFGGFIGNMCYDPEEDAGARLSVSVTMDISGTDTENIALAGSDDMGLACGHMEEKTELTFALSGTRGISSISTSGGDVGGLVGEMENGSILTYNSANFLGSSTPISTTASGSYAGGLVGKNTGATVDIGVVDLTAEPTVQYVIEQNMTGTAGAGGVYGYYKPAEALVPTTVNEVPVDKSVNTKNYDINCRVNGTGSTGGLFGVLDAEYDVTINGGGTVTSNHASGSCTSYGGLVGKYVTDSLDRTLVVTNVTAVPSKEGSATYFGGCIGTMDSSVQSYASFDSVNVTASNAGSLTFGGLVASADNAFIDVDGATVTAGGLKGGGLVGSLDHGVLRLDGTVDLTGATPTAPGTGEENKIGKVVGWRDDALVFARSTCNLTKPDTTVDDIGSWGQVIRFDAEGPAASIEKLAGTEVLNVNEITHAITIAAPSDATDTYKKIASVSDYAKTALCFQIDAGKNDFISFANTSYDYSSIGSQSISLAANVDLSNTGFINLTRDNNIGTENAETKCTYAGTSDTQVVFDGKSGSDQYSITYGGPTVYRHSYTGLFGITNNATIQNTTFAGNLNVNAKEATMYAGSAAGTAKGKFIASDLIIDTTINHNGDKDLYVGGVLGEASSAIGDITASNINANARMIGHASAAETCLGGVIGKISHAANSTSLKWSFSGIDIAGSIINDSSLDRNQVGGLVAVISGGAGATSRTLDLDDITVKGLNISVNSKSNGSVGGVLGYSWAGVDADFDNVEVGTSASGTVTTPTITQTNNSAAGVDLAGLVYSGSGYWTVKSANDLKVTALKINSENAQSFGMILNRGWNGNSNMSAIETAVYLELQNASAYSITAANISFKKSDDSTDMTIPVFDELVAHTAFYTGSGANKVAYSGSDPDNLYILQNGQGVVSIQTSGENGGLTMNGSDASGTYTPATTYGQQMNPFARYYYNLYSMKSSTTGAAGLMSWGAKWYAHSSIKSDVSSNTSWGSTIPSGTYDLQGYSWYPLNIDSAVVSINGTFTFYNKEFEGSETVAAATDGRHTARTSLYSNGTTQHYLMHSALFNNVGRTIDVGTITLKGSIPQIDTTRTVGGKTIGGMSSGVLALGTLKGSGSTGDATAKISTTSVILDGIYVHNFDVNSASEYAPLLINKSDDYSTLTIRGVKVASDASYKNNTNVQTKTISGYSYPKAATSLIGNVGSSNESKNINVSFNDIKLDGREAVLNMSDLNSAYHTDVSIFTRATLLNRLCFDTGKGLYTYSFEEDWNNGAHSTDHCVTYGKEVGYDDTYTNTQYPDQERWYLNTNGTVYVNPISSADSSGTYSVTFVSDYLPYVAVPYDSTKNYYQLEVNHTSSVFGGCGTYNDPYTITSTADFNKIYDILANSSYSTAHSIYIPMKSETAANLSATWHDSNEHGQYVYDTSLHEFYLDGDSSKESLTVQQIRTYVAGAYYLIEPENNGTSIIISGNDFKGLGNTTDTYAQFRGVIVGDGNDAIINKTNYPLIAYSNGSVIKNVKIEVDKNTAAEGQPAVTENISKDMASAKDYDATNGGANYGAVIGSVLGGDNIIDGVTVTFKNTIIELKGNAAQFIPVGGYVGVILNGGVIFRGMEGKKSGISGLPSGIVKNGSKTDLSLESNKKWLYVNPIIGRVINGYAVTEASAYRPFEDGTRVYHGGARTLDDGTEDASGLVTEYWAKKKADNSIGVVDSDTFNETEYTLEPVTMRNGNKHYSIADIDKNLDKLDTKGSAANIEVPNGQAFFIMSLAVNSGMSKKALGYNQAYQVSRSAKYSSVEKNLTAATNSVADYNSYAKNDKLNSSNVAENRGYIWNNYTIDNVDISATNNRTLKLSTSNGNYYLPDGYKGIGNFFQDLDNTRMKITSFDGNNSTISQNTYFYYYDDSSSYSPISSNKMGLGLINYTTVDGTYQNFYLTGNLTTDLVNKQNGAFITNKQASALDPISNNTAGNSIYLSTGMLLGTSNAAITVKNIALKNVYLFGLRNTGGMIGYLSNLKTLNYIIEASVEDDAYNSDMIKVHGRASTGGLVGKINTGYAKVDMNNHTFNLNEVVCECTNRGGNYYDYGVGGFIGMMRAGQNGMDSEDNPSSNYFRNIVIGTEEQAQNVTCTKGAEMFTAGVVGILNKCKGINIENCTFYNLSVEAKYAAAGLVAFPTTYTPAVVSNTHLYSPLGSSIESNADFAGGLIGSSDPRTDNGGGSQKFTFNNCSVEGYTLSGKKGAGGAIGFRGAATSAGVRNLVINNSKIQNCVIKSDGSAGGLIGEMNEPIVGYNVLSKNVTLESYTPDGSITNAGYICGRITTTTENVTYMTSGNSRTNNITGTKPNIKIVGFSRQADDESTMEPELVGACNYGTGFGTDGYVIFADYNDHADSVDYQNKLFSNMQSIGTNVKTMRSRTVNNTTGDVVYGNYDTHADANTDTGYTSNGKTTYNENYPYVTSSRKFDIDGTNYLTGDGVSSYSYGSSAFWKITNDRKNDTRKSYKVFNELENEAIAKIESEYSDSYTEFKSYLDDNENNGILRFPLLIAEDTNRSTLTTLINNYLDTLTNTTYNFADTTNSAVFDVGLYKCTYKQGTKKFDVDIGSGANSGKTACLKKMEVTLSGQKSYYFYMEASDVDTGDIPQFSLMDVMFKDPSGSGNVAYHLYVPVYVRKVLRYDFNAEIRSGTDYNRDEYTKLTAGLTQNTRSQGLFENIGNPVTISFEYRYTRSADEWVAALNAGDSLLTNYYKSLTIKNHNGNNWPDVTRLVLVDANNKDKFYYLDTPPAMNNAQTTYISLYDFTDSNGNRFAPAPMQNLMTVTLEQSEDGTLTPTAGNTATGATVYDGTTYYRPITGNDTSLSDSDKYSVTSVTDIKPERYYLSIFTKLDTSDENIYRYEISSPESFNSNGTGVTYTDENWSVDNWRANKIDKSTILNLFIGNLYDNDLTLSVTPQKSGSQIMAGDNRYLDITMTANVNLTEKAVLAGIPGNMSSFQNKAEIYQTFLMMYDKLEADGSSEVGISLEADGAVGDISHKFMGGDIPPASFDMASATAVDNEQHIFSEQYVELRNGQNLIRELYKQANNYAVTIQVDFEMVYAPNALGYQFPKREDGSLISSGSSVIGYSKIASTVEGAANSAAFDKDTDPTRYYISDESSATLEYNVVTSKDIAGQYHYLGINSVETGDDECSIDTYAVYDTRALKSTGDYIELTMTLSNKSSYVQATVGNPAVSGTALPIEDYLTDLKIYGTGDSVIFEQGADPTNTANVVTTEDSTIYKVRVNRSLLKTQTEGVYYIPIDYKVKTGNALFNNDGLMYSNYKVSLTAAMYPAIDSVANNYSKASYAYDHIIYTNARVVPEVIEP